MNSTIKNLAIVVGIIVLLVGAIFVYTKYFVTNDQLGLTEEDLNVNFPGVEIKAQLERVKGLNLDAGTVLFADAAYNTLQDSTITLVEGPTGRSNPFAPVGKAPSTPVIKAR